MLRPPESLVDTTDLFQRAEIRAEALIAWLRLGIFGSLVIVFFVVLASIDAPVAEVLRADPVLARQVVYAVGVMGAYFLLGLVCLLAIRVGRFRPWMVWPSAAGDCLFILVGIWLSLVNTGLLGDYMVLLPTIWLVPVVLACGVLRFNPRVQAFTICVLLLGMMLVHDLTRSLGPPDSLENLAFLFAVPPNIMRLAMLALAGAVLVVATYRTRALFLRTLAETEQRINLTRYVPAEVAPQLAQSGLGAVQRGQRKDMGVMFVDIRGFTALAETLAPEALGQFVTEYRHKVASAARAHGGIIDKFMGDAAMIVFDPGDNPTAAAARALSCGEAILEAIAQWAAPTDTPARVGVGLHWGPVFVGVLGDADRLEYSVFGDTVNIAARLEALTKEAGVSMIASRAVLEVAGADRSAWQTFAATPLRGRSAPMELYGRS